jgi:hypothetical protein
MTTMPSPVDLRIWLLSRTLGWSGRKVAGEVGVSQPTVVRTLERLDKEPPTEQEINDFVNVSATPPRGLPAITGKIKAAKRPSLPGRWIFHACAVLVTLAVVAIMAGFAVKLLSPAQAQVPASGQIACVRFAPDGSIAGFGSLNHGTCPRGQFAVTIVQNP